MGLFDKLKNTAASAVGGAVNNAAMSIGNKSETFTFTALPESLAQMQALPEASLDSPFKTAALYCVRTVRLCGRQKYRYGNAQLAERSPSAQRYGNIVP